MHHTRHVVNLVLLFFLLAPAAAAQGTRERVEAAIRFLADDLLEGRGTPSRGLDIAALYLASQLRADGWEPANRDSYFQSYSLGEFAPQQARYSISIAGQQLDSSEFIFLPIGMDPVRTPVQFEVVFAGHAVVAPERNIDDLAGVELKDKAVVALLGAPWKLDPATPYGYDHAVGKSISATGRGAGLLVYVSEELISGETKTPSAEAAFLASMRKAPLAYLPEFNGKPAMGIAPILALAPAVFDRTLGQASGATYRQWQARLQGSRRRPQPIGASIRVQIEAQARTSQANNVVAALRGSDPALRDEWIVLTAHYDHLGSFPVPPGQDGIWNGADDNASGTAAVLEVARRLSTADPAPRRSVLVLFTSGEDRGLLGSAHYSRHPVVPYEKVVANVNIDMVGRSSGSVQGIAPGSQELFDRAVESGLKNRIQVLPDQQPSWRILYLVDSYHFARFDVPIIEFFTGLHPDYHQPSDEVDRIRYDELGRILEVMSDLTLYYARGGKRPGFSRPGWFFTPE